jgi:hypothetical protein
MSDDERLAALFRDAASDAGAPPPGFGHDEVVAASRRITARRRASAIAASAVVGLVGLGAAVVLPQQYGGEALTSAAAPVSAPEAAGGAAADSAGGSAGDASGPGSGSSDRSEAPMLAPVAPPAPAAGGCADRHDAGLRALVAQVLPEVAAAPDAPATGVCLPPTDRYLSVEVAGGVLTVGYLPPGSIPSLVPGALMAPAASGGTVIVMGPDALADRLPAVLERLTSRL